MIRARERDPSFRTPVPVPARFRRLVSPALVAAALAAGPGAAGGADPPSSPCEDPRYLELRRQPIGSMSDEEYALFTRLGQACLEHQDRAAKRRRAPTRATEAPPPPPAQPPAKAPKAAVRPPRTFWATIHAGVAPPTRQMADHHRVGRSLAGGIALALDEKLAIEMASFGLDHFPLDKASAEASESELPSGSITVLSITAAVRARFRPAAVSPYVVVGAGYFRATHWDLRQRSGEITPGTTRGSLGMVVGGGIEGRVSERSIAFSEARAHVASTAFESSVYLPLRAGIRVQL